MDPENTETTSRRKKMLYLGLFSFQVMVVFWPLLSIDLIDQKRMGLSFDAMGMIETVWVLALVVTNVLFIREFIKRKWILVIAIFSFALSIVASTLARAIPAIANDPYMFNLVNGIGLFLVLINLIYTFYVAVKDIFRIKHDVIYSLIGAANIFLLIGSIFAFIIALFGTIFPGMVVPVEQALTLDIRANELAFFTLGSIDLPYNDVNPFIRKILVLESIFSHLFVVIIIGRLLSK